MTTPTPEANPNPDDVGGGDVAALADALRAAGVEQGYVGAHNFRLSVARRLLGSDWLAAREAAAEQRGRQAALREAADDQAWWLTETMDGDFLIVDCGHIRHPDGVVGLSDLKPTDMSRWVAQHLRERADRQAHT